MKKLIGFTFILCLLLLSYTVRYRLESNAVENLQNQFDSLSNDVIFSQQEVKRSIIDGTITGRISIHDFPSLGIKIYSDDQYSESFKKQYQFVAKNGNMLVDPFLAGQYIEVIAKDPSEDMENIYEKKYLKQFGTGCYTSIETGNSSYFTGKSAHDIVIYNAIAISGGYMCYVGKPDTERYIKILYNRKKTDRYYIAHLADACAPGKCNVFNTIELY